MTKKMKTKLCQAALFLFAWIIIVNLFVYIGANRFNLTADTSYEWMIPAEQFPPFTITNFADSHIRWDSLWYLNIAENGYSYNEGQLSNIVFFPVYPALVALFGFIFGLKLSGWIVSILALIAVVLLLTKYVNEHHKELDSNDVIFFLLTFPTAIFFNSVYTESLFLFFTISTFYFALKKNFWVAGVFGALAALTRVTGVLLVIPLLIEYVLVVKNSKKKIGADLLALALVPVATGAFFLFHWIQFGDPLLFFEVQSTWGRGFTLNSKHFLTSTLPQQVNLALDVAFALFAVVSTVFVAKRFRLSYAVYMFFGFIIPIITGTLMSIGRYVLVLFPIYFLAASIKNPVVKRIWMFVSILLCALYIILYSVNYWAG